MADFKKGSYDIDLPGTRGTLALRHRKIIRAGITPTVNVISNTFTIYDEDAGITNDSSDSNTYVTASVFLHAPAILNCFVQTGVIESTSQSSTIPPGLKTSNVEYISNTSWNIKFSYAGKNFVISPLDSDTITCKSLSLYRHTISLFYSSHPTFFGIYFDIINNYSKSYTTLRDVKTALKAICDNNDLTTLNFPCSGHYYVLNSDSNYYPYGNPNGFVTNIIYSNTNSLKCNVCSLNKNIDADYGQATSTRTITSSNVSDTVQLLA